MPIQRKKCRSKREGAKKAIRFFMPWVGCCVVLLQWFVGVGLGQSTDVPKSVVKVYVNCEFPGVLHEGRFIPQVRVEQTAELEGAVVDSRGYIVSYVGDSWPEFTVPGGEVGIWVENGDGKKYPARLVGVDERLALAVFECGDIRGECLEFGKLDTADFGFVSLVKGARDLKPADVVKLNIDRFSPQQQLHVALLRPGLHRSEVEGGLVLDRNNLLAGIVTRGRTHPFSKKIQVLDVLPSEVVRRSVEQIVTGRKGIKGGWLGVMLSPDRGLLRVNKVIAGSPAEEAGLLRGDIIAKADEQRLGSLEALARLIRWKGAGAHLNLSVLRNGRTSNLAAVLSHRQDSVPMVSWRVEIPHMWEDKGAVSEQFKMYRTVLPPRINLGLLMEPVTPQLAKFFGCPTDQGLLVKSVLDSSVAQQAGFKAGDVITQINGRGVGSTTHLEEILRNSQAQQAAVIQFVRKGRLLTRKLVLQ